MQVNITGHHVEVTPALKTYVESKLERIHRHFSNITNVHVILSVDKKFQQKAEARVNLAKGEVFAESEAESMYAAIDQLIDRLDRQVTKHKEMLNDKGNGDGTL